MWFGLPTAQTNQFKFLKKIYISGYLRWKCFRLYPPSPKHATISSAASVEILLTPVIYPDPIRLAVLGSLVALKAKQVSLNCSTVHKIFLHESEPLKPTHYQVAFLDQVVLPGFHIGTCLTISEM